MSITKLLITSVLLFITGVVIQGLSANTATNLSNMLLIDYVYVTFYAIGIGLIPIYAVIYKIIKK